MRYKKFYTEYVRHCLRFYARFPKPTFRSDVDKNNWQACNATLNLFGQEDKALIKEIYRSGDTIPDMVYKLSQTRGISQESLWQLISEIERDVAKRRGLI